jgi:hypothetical protein
MPKMVPRLSLPAITSARSTPGSGLLSVCTCQPSHLPWMAETSSAPDLINWSISALLPTVPMMTMSAPAGLPSFAAPAAPS